MKYTHVSSAIVMEDAQEDASRIPPPHDSGNQGKIPEPSFNKY